MWPLSNSAPTCVRASSGSPTRIRHISSASFAVKTSATERSTTSRLPPTQHWPALKATPSAASSRSASANTMCGFLPPSSRPSFLMLPAEAAMALRPVSVEPVTDTMSMLSLSSSRCPTTAPRRPAPPSPPPRPGGAARNGGERGGGRGGGGEELAQPQRRAAGGLRRLDDGGAARGQDERQPLGQDEERKVPWRDPAHHAQRLAQHHGQHAFAEVVVRVALHHARRAGSEAPHIDRAVDLADRLGDRLAGLQRFDQAQLVGVGRDQVGDLEQHHGALARAHARPGAVVEGLARLADGGLGVVRRAYRPLGHRHAMARAVARAELAGSAVGELAADEHAKAARRRGKGDGVVHECPCCQKEAVALAAKARMPISESGLALMAAPACAWKLGVRPSSSTAALASA